MPVLEAVFLDLLEGFLFATGLWVALDDCVGRLSPVLSGVPQGSLLGPILYVLQTSDLFQIVQSRMNGYADDAYCF